MAKKKKKSWIEQRDEMIKAGSDIQSAKGDFSPTGNAKAKFEEEHARVLHSEGTKGTTKTGSAFTMSVDPSTKASYQNDRYNSHLVSNLATQGFKVPVSALKSYKGAADFLASQGIDSSDLMTQKDFIKKSDKTYNQGFDLQDFVYRANQLDPNKTATQLRQSYNDINAVKSLANTRKSAEQLLKDVDAYEKKYGKSDATKTIKERAKIITDYINQNAKGGSAASNEIVETREAMFKPTKPGEIAPVAQVKNKYAAINDYNLEEKYGKVKYNGVKKETTYDYDELLKAKTPAEKEFADVKRLEVNPARAYQDNKNIIKGLGDSKEDLERKTNLEEQNNYYLYQKGRELQKKIGMDSNSMIVLADSSRKGEYYMFGSDIPGFADGAQSQDTPTLSAPKKGTNTDTWENRLERTGDTYNLDDPRDYRGKGGSISDSENGLYKVKNKEDMLAILQKKGLSKDDAKIYLDYAKDYGSKRWEKMNYEAGKEAGENNNVVKNLAIDIGMSATSVPRAILGQTGLTDDFEKDLRAKEQGFEETKKKDMNDAESFLYDVGETVGSIALNSAIYGGMGSLGAGGSTAGKIAQQGATALPFATKAAQDSYYTALDKGASETKAKLYGAASGLITELIYSVKLGNLGKIAKGQGSGIVSDLAKKIIDGKVAPSVGKAALASIGKGALQGGAAFGKLTAEQKVADLLTQTAILGDKNDIKLIYEKYKDQGLSEDEAWKETAKDVGVQFAQQILTESAKGAVMGAGGAALNAIRQSGTYNEMRDTYDELKADYDKYTADKSSPYFTNVETQEELNRQYKRQSQLLHPDVEGGSEEAFTSLTQDKNRIEGILSGEYKAEAKDAIDKWETFVNQAREIIGQPKQMTTRMKEQFAKDYGDAKTKLLELRDEIATNTTPETEAENTQIIDKIDTQINDIEPEIDVIVNEPAESSWEVENFEPIKQEIEPGVEIEPITEIEPSGNLEPTNIKSEISLSEKSKVKELATKSGIPSSEVDKMADAYKGTVSPRIYTNTYNMFYILGKDSNYKSIGDVFENMPQFIERANDITPEAAGKAFSAGKYNMQDIKKVDLSKKPSGKFVNNTGKQNSVVTYLNDMATRTGLDIYLDYDIKKVLGEKAKGINGIEGISQLSKGKIFVDANSANVLATAQHEVAEQIKNLAADEFAPLEKFMTTKGYKSLGAKGFEDVIDKYRKAYPESNDTELRKEYVCDMFGTLMSSPEAFEKFYEDALNDPNLSEAEKKSFKETVKEIINKIITALKNYMEKHGLKANTEHVLDETIEGTTDLKTVKDAIDYGVKLYDELKNKIDSSDVESEISTGTEFSLKTPVEETKELVAVHNLNENDLLNTIELGGFPMPSIAITKAEFGHSEFGNISVVFDKDTIDPSKRDNKVYSGDAWTPAFPEIKYKLNESMPREILNKITDLVGKEALNGLGNKVDFYYDNMYDLINRHSGDYITAYKDNPLFKLAYLKDTGKNFDLPMKEKEYRDETPLLNEVLNYVKKNNYDIKELSNSSYSFLKENNIINDIRDIVNKQTSEELVKDLGSDATKEQIEKAKNVKLWTPDNFDFAQVDRILSNALKLNIDLEKGGIPKVIDVSKTRSELNKLVNSDNKNYKNWLDNIFDGIVENKGIRNSKDLYTPSGNRRKWETLYDAVNLENVVKNMKEDTEKGAGLLNSGNVMAASTYEFKDIDDIRNRKNLLELLDEDEYKEIRHGFIDRFSDIVGRFARSPQSWESEFGVSMDTGEVLSEAIANSKTFNELKYYLKNEVGHGYKYSDEIAKDTWDLVKDIQKAPTGYFEAKPRRAVGLDEIAYVILPDNTSDKLVKQLNDNNIDFKYYEDGNEEERKDLLNNDDIKFSKKIESEYDSAVKEDDMEKAAVLVKDYAAAKGYTVKVYHGTQQFGFTQIDLTKSDDEMSFFATPDNRLAETYSSKSGVKQLSDIKTTKDYKNLSDKEVFNKLHENTIVENRFKFFEKNDIEKRKSFLIDYAERFVNDPRNRTYPEAKDIVDSYNKFKEKNSASNVNKLQKAVKAFIDSSPDHLAFLDADSLDFALDVYKSNNKTIYTDLKEIITRKQAEKILFDFENNQGNYELYANTNNLYEVDAKGSNWNSIKMDLEDPSIDTIKHNLRYYYDGFKDWAAPKDVTYNENNNSFDLFFEDGGDWDNTTITLEQAKQFFKEKGYRIRTRDIAKLAKDKGYKGITINNVIDNGGLGKEIYREPTTIYAFFNPTEQVKSADPVTYDDNGNVVPLEKRFDKDFDDIRFSINPDKKDDTEKELSKEIKENDRLRFLLEKAEREVKRTNQTHKISSADISKTVTDLKRDLDSKIDGRQLFRSINRLYTSIAQSNNLKSSDNIAEAESIIRDILDYPKTTRSEEASKILRTIKNSPIYIDDKLKEELEYKYGSYKSWKDKYFGTITPTEKNTAKDVSETWYELKEKYPEVFTSEPINEQDMLISLSETIDDLKNPETTPLEESLMMSKDDIISTYAVDLLTRYANTPKSRTLADELFELRAEKKDAFIKAKIAGKAQGREEQRVKNALYEANKKEQRINNDVKKVWDKIYKRATEPTYHNQGHLTKGWAKAVSEFAELMNFNNENSGEYQRIREENARKRYLDAQKNNAPDVNELKEKWEYWDEALNRFNQKASDKAKALAKILEKEDGLIENQILYDELLEFAESVSPNSDVTVPYYRLTTDEKQRLIKIGRMILKENEYQNRIRGKYKLIGNSVKVRGGSTEPTDVLDVKGAVEQAVEELKDTPKAKGLSLVNKFVSSIQTPEAIFDRVGGHHKNNIAYQLWKMVEDAQEDQWEYERQAYETLNPVLNETDKLNRLRAKELQKYDEKHLVDLGVKGIDADGKEVDAKVTRDIMLDIYQHISKPQNLRHVAIGGYTIPNLKGYYKGDMDKAFDKGQVLIPGITKDLSTFRERIRNAQDLGDLAKADELYNQMYNLMDWQTDKWKSIANTIRSQMTDYELALVEAVNKVHKDDAQYLGKASDAMYGVDLFDDENGVKDYYPMHVDKAYLGADIDYGADIETNLGTAGFAQRRVNSDKPLLGGGIIKTTLDHIAKSAKYYAYLIPQHNMNAVLNGQVHGYSDNFKKLLQQRDKAALNYIERWKRDMFGGGGITHDGLGEIAAKLGGAIRRNYSAAVLNLNPSVALYQHLSFFMFLIEAGYKNTAKGLFLGGRNKDIRKMIDEATNFLWDRDAKGGMVETEALKADSGLLPNAMKYINRATGGHLDWIHNSDMRTVTRGGAVAKYELLDQGYDPSDVDEWNKQFREVYRALMKTGQPLADTVHRPEIQRSNHEIIKFLAMFYTVRLQMLNTMMLENARYKTYKRDFKEGKYNTTSEDVKNQKGRAKRSIVAVLLSQGSVVAAKMLIYAFLFHQNYDIEDENGNVTAESIAKGFLKGTAKSLIELIPLTSEIEKLAETITGVLSGDTYSSQYEGISLSGMDAFKSMVNNIAQDIKKVRDGKYDVSKDIDKDLKLLSQMLGIPYGSISKVIKGGLLSTFEDLKDDDEFNFSDLQSDSQKVNSWIMGDTSYDQVKDLLTEDKKQTVTNDFKKLYQEGQITKQQGMEKMIETGLFVPKGSYKNVSQQSFLEGKYEWWDIEAKYKDEYISTLTDKNQPTAKTRAVSAKIATMPHSNIYNATHERLPDKIKKWHRE